MLSSLVIDRIRPPLSDNKTDTFIIKCKVIFFKQPYRGSLKYCCWSSQVSDVDRRRLWWSSMSISFLKHYYNFSITFNVILRSISHTGKVGRVIIFNILEHPKIVKSRLKWKWISMSLNSLHYLLIMPKLCYFTLLYQCTSHITIQSMCDQCLLVI